MTTPWNPTATDQDYLDAARQRAACPGCAQRDTVIDHLWHELRLARRASRVTRCTPPWAHMWSHGASGPCDCGARR